MIVRPYYLDMLKDDLTGNGISADHVIQLRYTSEELDELAADNINGVKIVHLADFLLSRDY